MESETVIKSHGHSGGGVGHNVKKVNVLKMLQRQDETCFVSMAMT